MFLLHTTSLSDTLSLVGYLGIASIVFAESGLFFGFFLPGDSLLFTAGVLASAQFFSFPLLLLVITFSAIAGDAVGYLFGKHFGKRFFTKQDGFWRNESHVKKAEEFYEKYGKKAIVLCRFVPVVRTFVPIVAGIAHMRYRTFAMYNVLGAALWSFSVTGLGYFFGSKVPGIENHLTLISLVIIILSVFPIVIEVVKEKKRKVS